MGVKILLDLQALERIIGEDSDVQLELRNGVVQTFCTKYLKGLVTEDLKNSIVAEMQDWLKEYKAEIKKEIIDLYVKQQGSPIAKAAFKLTDKAKVELREEFKKILSDELFGSIKGDLMQAKSEFIASCEATKQTLAKQADLTIAGLESRFESLVARAVEGKLKKMLERGLVSYGQS